MDQFSDNRNIVIVGNATPEIDYSRDIESADEVVRFNACQHFHTLKTGSNTGILCIRAFGSIGKKFADGTTRIDPDVIDACHTIWFVGEYGNWAPKIIERYNLEKKNFVYFPLAQMNVVDKLLNSFGSYNHGGASLGTMATTFLLSQPEFTNARVRICCFGFEGWEGHPWVLEKRLMMYYQYKGRIEYLPDQLLSVLAKQKPILAENVVVREQGSMIALSRVGGNTVKLSNIGKWILKQVDGKKSFETLCQNLENEAENWPDELDKGIAQFLWKLADLNLLIWK